IRTAFLAQARFALSLSRPPDSTERHMPAYLLSGTTRPKRRQPENNTRSAPSRRQISDAPRRTQSLSEILLRVSALNVKLIIVPVSFRPASSHQLAPGISLPGDRIVDVDGGHAVAASGRCSMKACSMR